ncbi:S-adenosyl-L-methionine-dependent methyltransferase [Dissophora ornata]|nr:S-adenosyl-L-methionine-dependent methyltransferase [Dissophora ornata]
MDSDDDIEYPLDASLQSDGAPRRPSFSLDNLPAEFVAFLTKNEIDPAIYTVTDLPRYVRFNPDPHHTITPEALEHELGTKVEPVPGLEAFCRLSGHVKLRNTQAYIDGRIFGMDLSSGIAVYALDVQPGDHVLDICCAPGAKLCMIAGLLTNSGHVRSDRNREGNQLRMDLTGTVTGVDISVHRLSTCRSLLKRHRLQQYARLFQADGTTFGVMRPSAIDTIHARIMSGKESRKQGRQSERKRSLSEDGVVEQESDMRIEQEDASAHEALNQFHKDYTKDGETSVKRQKATLEALSAMSGQVQEESTTYNGADANSSSEKMVPFYAPKILRNDPQLQGEGYKYDKVIVDAECTHDGSIAHILKYESWGWDSFHKNFMAQDRLDSLADLQRGLLLNGFRLTKSGGIVVYSTCSLSRAQNEDVVAWFLAKVRGRAVLEPLPKHALGIPTANCKRPCRSIVANALGLKSNGASASPGSEVPALEEWHGSAEQEAEMKQLQDHVMNLCLRYDPIASHTSGFFLARIRKIA